MLWQIRIYSLLICYQNGTIFRTLVLFDWKLWNAAPPRTYEKVFRCCHLSCAWSYLNFPSVSARSDDLQVKSTWKRSKLILITRACNVIPICILHKIKKKKDKIINWKTNGLINKGKSFYSLILIPISKANQLSYKYFQCIQDTE